MTNTNEQSETLWTLWASPLVWATHFLASYITAAIYCAKVEDRSVSLDPVRIAVAVYTLLALGAITAMAISGWKRHSILTDSIPHHDDSPVDRHRFLGFATFLLSALSFVATVFVAITVVFVKDCN
jgi:hypothetical protein